MNTAVAIKQQEADADYEQDMQERCIEAQQLQISNIWDEARRHNKQVTLGQAMADDIPDKVKIRTFATILSELQTPGINTPEGKHLMGVIDHMLRNVIDVIHEETESF